MTPFRRLLRATATGCALLYGLLHPGDAIGASAQDQQELVDRATLAVGEALSDPQGQQARDLLPKARAVMVCPRVFRAGFVFGGEGGAGPLGMLIVAVRNRV